MLVPLTGIDWFHEYIMMEFLVKFYTWRTKTRFVITAHTALLSRQPNVEEHAESGLEQYVYTCITDWDQEEQDPYMTLSSSKA